MKHWETIQIGQFSGPLDLLLAMVREKKMSLKDLNLVELTDQYLDYIESQKSLDIEIASEYLTMAAQLIEMKSRYLLPQDPGIETEVGVYEDFLEQLSRYEQIRSLTDFFWQKQDEYLKTFSKPHSKTKFAKKLTNFAPELNEELIDVENFDLEEFAQIFKRVMMNTQMRAFDWANELVEEEFSTITTENASPQEILQLILQTMRTNKLKSWRLEELMPGKLFDLKNLIATFLAILNIVRYQVATVQQNNETLMVEFTPQALEDESLIERIEVEDYE